MLLKKKKYAAMKAGALDDQGFGALFCIVTPAMLRWWTGKTNSLKPKSKVGGRLCSVHCAFRQHHGVHLADLKA